MRILCFDTETNGFYRNGEDVLSALQPHCVQLCARLRDLKTRKLYNEISLISYPGNFSIPMQVATIHGISETLALQVGVNEKIIGWTLNDLAHQADLVIGHNVQFDINVGSTCIARAGLDPAKLQSLPSLCTMAKATPIVNMPPTERMVRAGRRGPKAPKLFEAYLHFFGRGFADAHNAQADVIATEEIFYHMYDKGMITL